MNGFRGETRSLLCMIALDMNLPTGRQAATSLNQDTQGAGREKSWNPEVSHVHLLSMDLTGFWKFTNRVARMLPSRIWTGYLCAPCRGVGLTVPAPAMIVATSSQIPLVIGLYCLKKFCNGKFDRASILAEAEVETVYSRS